MNYNIFDSLASEYEAWFVENKVLLVGTACAEAGGSTDKKRIEIEKPVERFGKGGFVVIKGIKL